MMKIENIFEAQLESITAHKGKGNIQFKRIFGEKDFQSSCHFIDYVVVPSDCSIGTHRHGHEEEIYFIINGRGRMRINDDEYLDVMCDFF